MQPGAFNCVEGETMSNIDTRCGLHCAACEYKESHNCGGCIETNGEPFHGKCPVAACCQDKGLLHCGECDVIPCAALYAYSYLDREHGDKPQGARVQVCRNWAAERGKHVWENVLLTSAGFEDMDGNQKTAIVDRFLKMLGKPPADASVLFIPTAAIDDEAKAMVPYCKQELINLGIAESNIRTYDIDGLMTKAEAMKYDVIYFTGGNTVFLLRRIMESGLDAIIKSMVYANKVYVGVSAGSVIAKPNIGEPDEVYNKETAGLCLINAYVGVHYPEGSPPRTDFPLPHIPLTDNQAIAVRWDGYEVIE